ncbi:helix-turn-helix transcriptional regulator [Chryseobacterium sp. GCR10]|uniref:Helix-turn-helix transcriptional regulator n=2 Tax=Chryseobacterium caseinilyticum TaxID=2771428 RepID=A0ABR8ZGX2_9FLAO|nr:helix-turn-helix transcriptional regulator [Chryseobacterium caseinilyticum]
MHVENQTFQQNQTEIQRNDKFWRTVIYSAAIIILLGIGFFFYRRSDRYKKEKKSVQNELERIKELKIYSQQQFSNETLDNAILNSDQLSSRQKELLKLVAQGLTNKEIAEKLSVTEATIKYHFRKIYALLDIKNRREIFVKLTKK